MNKLTDAPKGILLILLLKNMSRQKDIDIDDGVGIP